MRGEVDGVLRGRRTSPSKPQKVLKVRDDEQKPVHKNPLLVGIAPNLQAQPRKRSSKVVRGRRDEVVPLAQEAEKRPDCQSRQRHQHQRNSRTAPVEYERVGDGVHRVNDD